MRNWLAISYEIEAQERKFLDAQKDGNLALAKDMLEVMKALLCVNRKTIIEALRAPQPGPHEPPMPPNHHPRG